MASFASAAVPKRILLIIDPQNDFSEPIDGIRVEGSLAVAGSNADYERIVTLIKDGNFDEIHVSLDTHTPLHIGHSNFYKDTAAASGINKYAFNLYDPDKHTPINELLTKYVIEYNKQHVAKRKSNFMIWPEHCIERTEGHVERTEGHKIVAEILAALITKAEGGGIVKYHIKGQNELTEMYSIFSATVNPSVVANTPDLDANNPVLDLTQINVYSGKNETKQYDRTEGAGSYEDAAASLNLDTTINTGLIEKLFGNGNTVYVCGQALTHCVKDSIKDLIEFKPNGHIVLIEDCSSPIGGDDEKNTTFSDLTKLSDDKKVSFNILTSALILSPLPEAAAATEAEAATEVEAAATEKGGARKTKRRRTTRKNRRANKRTNKRNKRRISRRR
jgi:nicotinamidase-related amidase